MTRSDQKVRQQWQNPQLRPYNKKQSRQEYIKVRAEYTPQTTPQHKTETMTMNIKNKIIQS